MVVEPGAHHRYPARVNPVDAFRALGLIDHELRLLQRAQMLRHGRPRDRQPSRQLADRLRPLRHPLEDRAPRRVGKGIKGLRSVSHYLP